MVHLNTSFRSMQWLWGHWPILQVDMAPIFRIILAIQSKVRPFVWMYRFFFVQTQFDAVIHSGFIHSFQWMSTSVECGNQSSTLFQHHNLLFLAYKSREWMPSSAMFIWLLADYLNLIQIRPIIYSTSSVSWTISKLFEFWIKTCFFFMWFFSSTFTLIQTDFEIIWFDFIFL